MPRPAPDDIRTPIHPGEVLRDDFLEPLGLSQYRLAQAIKVAPIRISQIVNGRRSITADSALRLARFLNTTPQFWMNLQAQHDLEKAEDELAGVIAAIPRHRRRSA